MRKKITKYTPFVSMTDIMQLPLVKRLFKVFKEKEFMRCFEKTPKPKLNKNNWFEAKIIIALLILILLSLPFIFNIFKYKNGELLGFIDKKEKPVINWVGFESLKYQNNFEKYVQQSVSFSDFFIRFSNEVRYRLFRYSDVQYVEVGKGNYLYMDSYVRSYLGLDYQGEEKINSSVAKLAQVRDSLKTKGVDLVFIIAPGKGTYYPEYLANKFSNQKPTITNYETYSKAFYKYNINYIDFNSWMCSIKDTVGYRLFSNTSVHWGQYACYLALDSLTHYFNSMYDITLPTIKIKNIKVSDKMVGSDNDVEKIMNLMTNISDEPMPRLQVEINTKDKDHLNVLTMGDSYFFGLNDLGFMSYIFKDSEFWYYFKEVRRKVYENLFVWEYDDIKKEIEKNQVILIIFTEGNLHTTPAEFCDQLHYIYCMKPSYEKELEWQIKKFKTEIEKNYDWKEDIKKKALKENKTLDKAIEDDADYMAKEYLKDKF
ncbi:MAG: hypothetical protein WCR29_02940 [Bacteroidales bacterium]